MTKNQIDYFNAREGKRHNLATEKETNRSNVARETETNRHNVVTEVEVNRHNKAGEIETNRHNTQTEYITRDQNLWSREFSRLENDRNYRIQKERNELTGKQIRNQAYQADTQSRSVTAMDRHYQRQDSISYESLQTQRELGLANVNVALLNAGTASKNAQTNLINAQTSRSRVTQQNLYDQGMLRNNTMTAQSQVEYQRNKSRVENQQVVIGYLNAGANLLRSSAQLATSLRGGNSYGKKTTTETQKPTEQELWWQQLEELIDQQQAAQ